MNPEKKDLLLIEDSSDDAELILEVLKESNLNLNIHLARDGVEALDYLLARTKEFSSRTLPHWIILDLKLPKVSGLEVLKVMRENKETSKIPVTIFTSSREEKDVIEGYRLYANSYLQKPIEYDAFENAVREMTTYWTNLNRYPQSWNKFAEGP